MYKIKTIPKDFIVKEISKPNIDDKGKYSYYLLKKKNYTTIDAINAISRNLKIKSKYINFAGTKDKVAVTEQYISISNGPKKNLQLKDIELKFLGKGNERLNLGDLEGNEFIITVRNLDKKKNTKKIEHIPNYFDEQRFGINKNNHIIGKHIIKKEFKEACDIIPEIKANNNDFIGALRTINKRILRMYVHAYQSYLFNKTIDEYVKNHPSKMGGMICDSAHSVVFDARNSTNDKWFSSTTHSTNYKLVEFRCLKLKPQDNIKLPIVGFGTEIHNQKIKNIVNKILKKENISFHDFIIRQIPELTSEGGERNLFAKIKNFKIKSAEKDELNKKKYKVVVYFFLEKGSYATNVIKQLFT